MMIMTIVRQRISVIRKFAFQFLRGVYGQAFLVLFMVGVIQTVPGMIVDVFAPFSDIAGWCLRAYSLVISGPLTLATAIFFVGAFRNTNVGINALSYGFGFSQRAIEMYINIYFRVFIGSLLFIAPGVMALIKYSFSYYILCDNATKSVRQCMRESAAIALMNMGTYVKLFLSFVPMYILCLLPRIYTAFMLAGVPLMGGVDLEYAIAYNNAYYSPLCIALGVLMIIPEVHFQISKVCLYDIAAGKLVFEQPAEVSECEQAIQ